MFESENFENELTDQIVIYRLFEIVQFMHLYFDSFRLKVIFDAFLLRLVVQINQLRISEIFIAIWWTFVEKIVDFDKI